MSVQSQHRAPGSRPAGPESAAAAESGRSFLHGFLGVQVAFLVLLLIASINEPVSAYNPATATTQMAMVAGLWVLTDVLAVTVHAIRVHGHHARR